MSFPQMRYCCSENINKYTHKAKGQARNSDLGHMPYHSGGTQVQYGVVKGSASDHEMTRHKSLFLHHLLVE